MKKILTGVICIMMASASFSQSVGIGTSTPSSSAQLEVSSTNKGFLPPRVALTSTTDVTTIATPTTGLLIFNTATAGTSPTNVTPGYYYYTGISWLRIGNAGNAPGDMQYWNGTQWVILPAGTTGQTLSICNGVPTWGPCGSTNTLATISTRTPISFGGTIATLGGNVTVDGTPAITSRGVCYATTANPTIANSFVADAAVGTGTYSVNITGLTPNTLYHYRAYATNTVGTAYGGDSTFTTTNITAPTITTIKPFGVGSNNATSGGAVTSTGNTTLTERGICYSVNLNPTTADTKVVDPFLTGGTFSSQINGLASNTTYHVRAYAINSVGTSYGGDSVFTTLSPGQFAATYTFDSVKTTSGLTDPSPVPTASGATFGSFSATGTSTNPSASFRFAFSTWSRGATDGSDVFFSPQVDTTSKYYQVTITPDVAKLIDLSTLSFTIQRSATGPRQCFVRTSLDGYAANIGTLSVSPADANLSVVATNKFQLVDQSISSGSCLVTFGAGFTNISTPITFRFYAINAEATGGTFSVDNVVFSGTIHN